MFVILWIKENKYYAYSKENHWTDNIYAAGKFNTLEAAQKYAKNSLKDKLQELQYSHKSNQFSLCLISTKKTLERKNTNTIFLLTDS